MISITIFDNLYDNKTDKQILLTSVKRFESFLYKMSEMEYESKGDASLMSPASFLEDTTRANDNVVKWSGWAAIDIDDYITDNVKEDLQKKYGKYHYICYSTASSTKEHPKFRLVFPLTDPVVKDKVKHFWFALNKELNDIGDAQTKDLSRMYYVPGTYKDAYNFIFTNEGELIDPDGMMMLHEYVDKTGNSFLDNLPKGIREQMITHRKNEMTNTNITWHNYKDCPFVSKKMVKEYSMITETGWYSKMYAIMVAIAGSAIKKKYPITSAEVAELCRQIDTDTGGWYNNRPLEKEAAGAIEYIYGNNF